MMLHKNLLQMVIANWLNSDMVIIDTETTGLAYNAEIIEISVIDMRGNVLLDTLVKPSCSIPPQATEINRITDEMVADAPSWREVYPVLMDIIGSRKWVGWKSEFDARLIVQSCLINGLYDDLSPAQLLAEQERIHGSQIDAKRTYSEWHGEPDRKRGGFKRQPLAAAVQQMGVKFQGNAHRSLADCYAVLHVLIRASKWVAPETMTMAQIRNSLPIVARYETTAGQALFNAMEESLFSQPRTNETPDGWQLVPIEPTEDMVIHGFESKPDAHFSKQEDWDAYQAMSGCEQAAHRAKLCWSAMLAAAPKQEQNQK
ncbi:3'-5' exonuclease [Atlantibacter sp.]|uniref:3'-5' exonuclease n=1 Tax=Atlantibacter sp. TaxID=1903473 RepID=UPI00289CD7ED|nr:3'-5' exonuclease [Atlantibacter sp.]